MPSATTKYSRWDETDRVIHTDASSLPHATKAQIDELFDELEALARSLPEPPYVVVCYRSASFSDTTTAAHYGVRAERLLQIVPGIVRYAVDDPITRATVRTEMMKRRDVGARSNFVATREEALALVRELEAERGPRSSH